MYKWIRISNVIIAVQQLTKGLHEIETSVHESSGRSSSSRIYWIQR